MRDDFCVFVLSHGRADNVMTVKSLRRSGYTGRLYVVVDDEDAALEDYRARFGEQVLVFSKDEFAGAFDLGDNFEDRRTPVYARNACWELARRVGCRYFAQYDDDYFAFMYRLAGRKNGEATAQYHGWLIQDRFDAIFDAMVEFLDTTGAATVAMSQGGDHIGGVMGNTEVRLTRKAMNSFICDAERPFEFRGRVNDDVNTYVSHGNVGLLFFTYWCLQLDQPQTQQQGGGMTELYLASGTYVKSFYTVMFSPSCTWVEYVPAMRRLHHRIDWNRAVPKIVHERYRKAA
jgi:hypothetical protein